MHKYVGLCLAVTLVVLSGCANETQPEVSTPPQVISPPAIDFTVDVREGKAPLTISFSVISTDEITHCHWDFGDGQFDSIPQPIHTYSSEGKYTVCLTVMGPGGSSTETKVDYIEVEDTIIGWEEAGDYIGQHKTIKGTIVGTYYAANVRGKPTFLNFNMPYKGYFTCVIWGSDRALQFTHRNWC
jgi:PKD repeat protein